MVEEGSEVKLAGPLSPKSPPVSAVKLPSPHSPKQPRRIKLTEQQLETITKEELAAKWREQDLYVECLEGQTTTNEGELTRLKESEEKYRQKYSESSHREKILVRRLASKEQELQEYVNQITEMKAAQAPSAAALRSALLDPAVNILIQKLRQELITTKAKLEDTQNELSAWKFTPDSNTGKRLMAKCRLLYQENEELGRMIASGRIAKLEGELALQKSFSEEVKKSQSELDEFLQDLDEDVEGMQSTIYFLQQELRKARESVTLLQQENSSLKLNTSEMSLPNGLSPHTPPAKKEEEEEDEEENAVEEIKSELVKSDLIVKMEVDNREKCDEINSSKIPSPQLKIEKEEEDNKNIAHCSEPENVDESSSDSAALVIKIETDELDDEKDKDIIDEDDDKNDDDDDDDKVCRKMLRTKGGNKSMVSGVNETNGDNDNKTNLIRGRDRTKRDNCDQDSDNEFDKVQKKKRRESILSLDYNETNDDTIIVTNGETLQSDPE